MARQRKGDPVHGWLILDKPQGMTSTRAVGRIKHLYNAAKAGHAGTLDPLATGVLPVALGEATKTVPYVVDGSKRYRFTVRFGAATDTDDADGKIIATSDRLPSREAVEELLPRFIGTILQLPPRYSALKVDGARAYDLAREQQDFELSPREVSIGTLVLVDMPDEGRAVIETECGKGTYVRALARDFGEALGTCAHVEALRRTRVGSFDEAKAVPLAQLEELAASGEPSALKTALLPVETGLMDVPSLAVSSSDAARLKQGQPVLLRGRDAPILEGTVCAVSRGLLIALGDVENGELHPKRIFNLS